MSSLLAILLVVNSTRGHHYLFSYPPNPKRPSANRRTHHAERSNDFTVGSSIAAAGGGGGSRATPSSNGNNDHDDDPRRLSTASKNKNNNNNGANNDNNCGDHDHEDIFAGRDTIFNLDVSFLADALAPKSPLCDRKFQLSMDDLTFVGHPVSLSTHQHHQPSKQQQQQPQVQQQQQLDIDELDHELTANTTSSPMSPAVPVATPALPNSPAPSINSNTPATPIQPPTPTNNITDTLLDQTKDSDRDSDSDIDDSDTSSSTSSENSPKTNTGQAASGRGGGSTSIHMTLFHVVFVMAPPDLELNTQVDTIYKNVILRYSSALRYEQLRCGYVQEEIEKVLGLKEEAFNKGTPYDQVMKEILRESSLARDIRQIYTAISANTAAHVIINDFIDLSLQIPIVGMSNGFESSFDSRESFMSPTQIGGGGPGGRKENYTSLMDIYSVAGYEYDNYPVLCPYHTLLLLEDPEEVLKNMPLDASPTLVQLVQILTPTQSLQELHLLLDCSLAQIYRLAAHLIYWRKAKLIHIISTRNIYVVSPNAKLDDISSLEADFKMHIPNLSLSVLLSKLAHAQQYHLVYRVKELKNQYLEAITYLIRKDLVVQLHMYLVLLVPPEKKPSGTDTPQSSQFDTLSSAEVTTTNVESTNTMSSSPNNNNADSEWNNRLKRVTYERAPKEVADLFERLKSYMNGQHHIEEIIYREGISRRQLGLVLKYYRDKIVTVYHY